VGGPVRTFDDSIEDGYGQRHVKRVDEHGSTALVAARDEIQRLSVSGE
jgi:hypothetical protein